MIILDYLKKLSFKSEPDYAFIIRKIHEAADSNNCKLGVNYDWTE